MPIQQKLTSLVLLFSDFTGRVVLNIRTKLYPSQQKVHTTHDCTKILILYYLRSDQSIFAQRYQGVTKKGTYIKKYTYYFIYIYIVFGPSLRLSLICCYGVLQGLSGQEKERSLMALSGKLGSRLKSWGQWCQTRICGRIGTWYFRPNRSKDDDDDDDESLLRI